MTRNKKRDTGVAKPNRTPRRAKQPEQKTKSKRNAREADQFQQMDGAESTYFKKA